MMGYCRENIEQQKTNTAGHNQIAYIGASDIISNAETLCDKIRAVLINI